MRRRGPARRQPGGGGASTGAQAQRRSRGRRRLSRVEVLGIEGGGWRPGSAGTVAVTEDLATGKHLNIALLPATVPSWGGAGLRCRVWDPLCAPRAGLCSAAQGVVPRGGPAIYPLLFRLLVSHSASSGSSHLHSSPKEKATDCLSHRPEPPPLKGKRSKPLR